MLREYWLRFKRFYLPYPLAYIGRYTMRLIVMTCKVEVEGLHHLTQTAENTPCILMLWHNRMAMFAEFMSLYVPEIIWAAFISRSRDGEPIARVVESYKNGRTIRVAHDARHQALKEMIVRLKQGKEVVVVTPDGPRGPRYKVKPGIVAAAKESGADIVPFTWEAERYWEFKTWDGFRIPKPFTKIRIGLGLPVNIKVERQTEEGCLELAQKLSELISATSSKT